MFPANKAKNPEQTAILCFNHLQVSCDPDRSHTISEKMRETRSQKIRQRNSASITNSLYSENGGGQASRHNNRARGIEGALGRLRARSEGHKK